MYKLLCGDLNNDYIMKFLRSTPEKAEYVRKTASIEKINYILFNEQMDSKTANLISASLTMADELQIPIDKRVVDILFFVLCNNTQKNPQLRIKNISQGYALFNLYKNDYRKIELQDNKKLVRFTELIAYHPIFMPGYTITWKLPVSFFKADNKSKVTLSGLSYCIVKINEQEYKVPREIYIKFFKKSMVKGRLVADSTDQIKKMFDLNNKEALKEVLVYLGFTSKKELKELKLPSGALFVENGKIKCAYETNKNNLNSYWSKIDNILTLLPKLDYVPIKHNGSLAAVDLLV